MSALPIPDVVFDRRCETCPVRHHAICSVLNNQHSHALSDIMFHKHLKRDEAIWNDDDDAYFFAIIVSGVVKLSKILDDGRQQILGLLFPSDCFGRAFSETQKAFAEAATDVEICCFPRSKFEQALKQHPELETMLLKKTLDDLDHARDWIVALGQKSATERVASFLCEMAHKSEQTKCAYHRPSSNVPTFTLPLTRKGIAEYLGLTVETVSRNFTKLKVNGIIRLIDAQTVQICDPDALADLSESET